VGTLSAPCYLPRVNVYLPEIKTWLASNFKQADVCLHVASNLDQATCSPDLSLYLLHVNAASGQNLFSTLKLLFDIETKVDRTQRTSLAWNRFHLIGLLITHRRNCRLSRRLGWRRRSSDAVYSRRSTFRRYILSPSSGLKMAAFPTKLNLWQTFRLTCVLQWLHNSRFMSLCVTSDLRERHFRLNHNF
jgi:hypothetical protein